MKKRIGDLLIENQLISPTQLQEVLEYSRRSGARFGEAALSLGFIKEEQLIRLFGKNYRVDFFYLDPSHFPENTKNAFSTDEIVRLGALPLGVKTSGGLGRKKRLLNVGLLNPGAARADELKEMANRHLGADAVEGVQVFLILADQFIGILRSVYGMQPEELRKTEPSRIDGVLSMFLESS